MVAEGRAGPRDVPVPGAAQPWQRAHSSHVVAARIWPAQVRVLRAQDEPRCANRFGYADTVTPIDSANVCRPQSYPSRNLWFGLLPPLDASHLNFLFGSSFHGR